MSLREHNINKAQQSEPKTLIILFGILQEISVKNNSVTP